tara:strand:+ start:101 stop:385 length:285 start_codon:yes stop_codon:yes gene_type:complete
MTQGQNMENRSYIILNSSDLQYVRFSEVIETSSLTLRYNLDKSKFFVSYFGYQPYFVFTFITKDAIGLPEYSQQEITQELLSSEWSVQISGITI